MSHREIAEQNNLTRLMVLFAFIIVVITITGAGCSKTAVQTTKLEFNDDGMTEELPFPPGLPDDYPSQAQIEAGLKPETSKPAETKPEVKKTVYKDGVYTAIGSYTSPAGAEEIGITLTIKNDLITDASGELKATNPKSINMQKAFLGGFKVLVVGKNLSEVSLTKVSGSSLTGKGFNDAVVKIRAMAKA